MQVNFPQNIQLTLDHRRLRGANSPCSQNPHITLQLALCSMVPHGLCRMHLLKISTYKWNHTLQASVVQESTVYIFSIKPLNIFPTEHSAQVFCGIHFEKCILVHSFLLTAGWDYGFPI